MTSVSAGHIILAPTQSVGGGRPQRESNPVPPHQESRDLPTELLRPYCLSHYNPEQQGCRSRQCIWSRSSYTKYPKKAKIRLIYFVESQLLNN